MALLNRQFVVHYLLRILRKPEKPRAPDVGPKLREPPRSMPGRAFSNCVQSAGATSRPDLDLQCKCITLSAKATRGAGIGKSGCNP